VFAFGSTTSGIPFAWGAKSDRTGVNLVSDMSADEARQIKCTVAEEKGQNDVVVASVHWGPNWGYEIPAEQRAFAHQLVDIAGVDVIHGHSSHHVLGIEVYRGRLILYGCGDFLDDYEGIRGYERYRNDLGLIYSASIDPGTGELNRLQMTPTQTQRMRVQHVRAADVLWLRNVLDRESRKYGVQIEMADEGTLVLKWNREPAWSSHVDS